VSDASGRCRICRSRLTTDELDAGFVLCDLCAMRDDFDADELGLDPEEDYD